MSEGIGEPWRTAFERKGITPTYRGVAQKAGAPSHETVRKVVQGLPTSLHSIRSIADLLGVDVERVHEWRGESSPDYGRMFEADARAYLLTTEEREVVNRLIRLLTDGREDVTGHAQHPAPIAAAIPPGGRVRDPGKVPGTPPP